MPYNPALDGVRALSILAVVLFHCEVPGARGGFIGLDIFFVLSGYLITSLLTAEHRHGGIEIGRFYARRALRLYPTLLLMIAVYVGLAPILWPADDRWLSAVLAALYVYDYAQAFWKLTYTIGHTWSLGVEEKFYLLWPLVLPFLLRTRHPARWLVSAFLVVTAWRYFVALNWPWQQAYFRFDTRMSGILLGAIAALTHCRVSKRALAMACMALLVLMALPSLPTSNQAEAVTLRITLAELSAFVLICFAAEHGKARFLASRPMIYIGRLSYGIYLWHFPLVLLLRGTQPLWITLSVTLAFSFGMAAICLHLVDTPLKRWRRKAWLEARSTA
ncbi:acyltransferase family protein [Variovorax sp. Varisp62]|uniref:acyltransferase family protein n=1 Tax=Variovorax sp. Varisp62 TaxID=3243049 RepID=UPI0039B4A8C2